MSIPPIPPTPTTPPIPMSTARRLWTYATLCSAGLMAACASIPPPTEQMAVSTAALTSANAAGAGQWAPMELRSAQDKLDRARLAMNDKNYEQALWLAQDAQVQAQLAEKKAGAGKAGKAADELREASRVLSEELRRKKP